MLNEVKEYELYLCGDPIQMPFHNRMLRENYSGIRRALQVLARGFLKKCREEKLQPQISIPACKAFLYTWMCGQYSKNFNHDSLPTAVKDEFTNAKKSSFLLYANSASTQNHEAFLSHKAKTAYQPSYSSGPVTTDNSFNTIYFDRIIADALYLGDLQNQCLVLKVFNPYDLSGKDNERKIALATVAQYLQLRNRIRNDPRREFIPIVQHEIGNWVRIRAKNAGKDSKSISVAMTLNTICVDSQNELLFDHIFMENNKKFRVNPDWLKKYQVQLIPASDAADYQKQSFCIITDQDLVSNE